MICKVCNSESAYFADSEILNKYKIKYYKCDKCGFIQTEEPYWLNEAYSDVINKSDIGYVGRNLILSKVTTSIINLFFSKTGIFLDYGAGYGLFVRLMRDIGFDFYWQDNYCENIFANEFETDNAGTSNFELVTGFELFEHFLNPIEEIEKILRYSRNILVSTFLIPQNNPKPGNWWYYGLEHGQHISIYSYESMKYIAGKYRLNLYSNKKNLHLFTEKKINPLMFKYVSLKNIYHSVKAISGKRSFHDRDYKLMLEKLKKK